LQGFSRWAKKCFSKPVGGLPISCKTEAGENPGGETKPGARPEGKEPKNWGVNRTRKQVANVTLREAQSKNEAQNLIKRNGRHQTTGEASAGDIRGSTNRKNPMGKK